MDLGIRGRRAIVCASSKGLGLGCAQQLAREGVELVMLARGQEALEAAAAAIRAETGVKVTTVATDITTHEGRAKVLAICPDPDILVTNAGGPKPGDFRDWSREDWIAAVDANMLTPIELIRATVDKMIARKFGRIVNISSRAALGKEERTVYSATKAGLLGMTRTWALEMAPYGITVNAIGPGPIATDLFLSGNPPDSPKTKKILTTIPLGRMGQPAEIAHAVASFIDDRAGFTTGQVLYVCGGMTVGLSHAA